jgi:hypothetical protein
METKQKIQKMHRETCVKELFEASELTGKEKQEELKEKICKNCGQTYENHPIYNPFTKRWSKSHIIGQHRLRKIKFMCKKFESKEEKA